MKVTAAAQRLQRHRQPLKSRDQNASASSAQTQSAWHKPGPSARSRSRCAPKEPASKLPEQPEADNEANTSSNALDLLGDTSASLNVSVASTAAAAAVGIRRRRQRRRLARPRLQDYHFPFPFQTFTTTMLITIPAQPSTQAPLPLPTPSRMTPRKDLPSRPRAWRTTTTPVSWIARRCNAAWAR